MTSRLTKRILLYTLALTLCTVPVLVCILSYFPVWIAKGGESVLGGFTILLIALSLIPLYKTVKKILSSPSSYTLWLISFIIFFLMSKIADEMTVISFVGFVSNALGSLAFKASEKYKEDRDSEK